MNTGVTVDIGVTILAYGMIIAFLALIMSKKVSPMSGLTLVPLTIAVIGCIFSLFPQKTTLTDVSEMMIKGIQSTAQTSIMLLFAILYFSLMLDVGLFDPLIKLLIEKSNGNPLKILMTTALVTALVSLDGDGTTTTLICCTAFLPIYRKLKMNVMNFAVILISMNTIWNLLPWGGPTARVVAMSGVDDQTLLRGIFPGMAIATIYIFIVTYFMGKKECARLGVHPMDPQEIAAITAQDEDAVALKRPKLVWFNFILTFVLMVLLVSGLVSSIVLFMVGFVLALLVNYHTVEEQKKRVAANAGDALQTCAVFMSAGVFMGIFTGSGMSDALAQSLIAAIPAGVGRSWSLVMAVSSGLGSFLIANDAYYYGVFPVLAQAGYQYGWTAGQIGVASLMGQAFHQISPLVAFIYLLLNKTQLDMGEWQKKSVKVLAGIFVIYIMVTALLGIVPLYKP